MPTPLQILMDPVSLTVLALYGALILTEALFPARPLPLWHRTMHRVHWLWRSFHQMHHSAERLDSYRAFYFSPLDTVGFRPAVVRHRVRHVRQPEGIRHRMRFLQRRFREGPTDSRVQGYRGGRVCPGDEARRTLTHN